ncbi:hypothetical protein AYO21_02205 [Fonsecaea monophora]|uniref:Isochorismatase-like domain-containing protein n=1 Tax=Fonsecaea monophora TaxID=254056 RepID=A0A177FKF0_9EURO|nr:hypothetical protein AYO21_02205 [Fonsecaea monophora]KAH0844037.1 Maleamate amidohydrolase [Fonsecaea pedrosoi]OAG43619.1 hypothetical protein AYO21_02205 [Fonsecaea monophora]
MGSAAPSNALLDSYRASGFANIMGWGSNPALILIDVCKAYWTAGSPLDLSANPPAVSAIASMKRLVSAARKGNVPIIWSQIRYTSPDLADGGLFALKAKQLWIWQDGNGRGLDAPLAGLEPAPGDIVIVKKMPSAFFGTTLTEQLQRLRVDTLVICGVSTSGCVRATTLDAMQNGFRPMVVGNACGDRAPEIQEANLFDLNAKYADVVSEEEAIGHLEAGWNVKW